MTSVTIPHRVAPSPSAASQTSRGVCAITSRLTDVMMGMIVTQQISPHAKIDFTYWPGLAVRKIGTKLAWATSHRAGAAWRFEMSSSPQKPYTMLGTVASMSTVPVSHGLSTRGAYSLIISARAKEMGAAMATAMSAIAIEPISKDSMPKWCASGDHVWSVTKPSPAWRKALNPYLQRKATAAAKSKSTIALAPASTPLNTRSAPTGFLSRLIGTSS